MAKIRRLYEAENDIKVSTSGNDLFSYLSELDDNQQSIFNALASYEIIDTSSNVNLVKNLISKFDHIAETIGDEDLGALLKDQALVKYICKSSININVLTQLALNRLNGAEWALANGVLNDDVWSSFGDDSNIAEIMSTTYALINLTKELSDDHVRALIRYQHNPEAFDGKLKTESLHLTEDLDGITILLNSLGFNELSDIKKDFIISATTNPEHTFFRSDVGRDMIKAYRTIISKIDEYAKTELANKELKDKQKAEKELVDLENSEIKDFVKEFPKLAPPKTLFNKKTKEKYNLYINYLKQLDRLGYSAFVRHIINNVMPDQIDWKSVFAPTLAQIAKVAEIADSGRRSTDLYFAKTGNGKERNYPGIFRYKSLYTDHLASEIDTILSYIRDYGIENVVDGANPISNKVKSISPRNFRNQPEQTKSQNRTPNDILKVVKNSIANSNISATQDEVDDLLDEIKDQLM